MSANSGSRDPIAQARQNWEAHGWEEAAAGMAATTSIMRAQQIMMGRADTVLRRFGLTFARYELLMLLQFSRKGELPMGVIGKRLQVHPASVTSATDRLERDGLAERLPHPQDRRAVLVAITQEGKQRARRATAAMNKEVFMDPRLTAQAEQITVALTDLRDSAEERER